MSTPQFETIGKYVLLEKLAMGGMAEVFLSRALGAGGISKFFAIKRILPQYADSPEFIDMFREEAKIAINLKHSNIVSIHEFGIQDQQFFLVMDYVEGRNLRQILNKMKKAKLQFSTEHIIYLVREIAAGLDHAHRCIDATTGKPLNITHRDMSPQNVMISFDGEVKIVDFGIAKAESQVETTRAGTLKGKFGYMSPEQAEGLSVDMRTDIFSLGIVMWEMLANDRLFAANNEINTLRKIRDCHIPSLRKINPNIHSDLEKIVQKALARDKNLRYQSAAALHKDLNRFLNRQYPDFSSHDFAAYIKTIFADEILQSRKKLVSYAKSSVVDVAINGSIQLADDKTMVTDSLVGTQTSSYIATETSIPSNTQEEVSMGGLQPETNSKIESSVAPAPQGANSVLDSSIFPDHEETNNTKTPASQTNSGVLNKTVFKPTQKFEAEFDPSSILREQEKKEQTSVPYTRTKIPVRIKGRRSPLATGMIYMVIAFAGFIGLAKFFPGPMSGMIEKTQPIFGELYTQLGISGKTDLASDTPLNTAPSASGPTRSTLPPIEPDFSRSIIIASEPSGAEIYIDGQRTGQITPSRLALPAQSFTLSLKRKGYDSISQKVDPERVNRKLSFTLKNLIQGFIDVDVKPLQDVTVYIDNRKVEGEGFPLRNYPIPANRTVVVRVVGSNGSQAQSKIQLRESQRHRLNFNLGQPSSRSPSNK